MVNSTGLRLRKHTHTVSRCVPDCVHQIAWSIIDFIKNTFDFTKITDNVWLSKKKISLDWFNHTLYTVYYTHVQWVTQCASWNWQVQIDQETDILLFEIAQKCSKSSI